MRSSHSSALMDWLVVLIRGLVLTGLGISLAVNNQLLEYPSLLLLGWAIWNVVLTLLVGLGRDISRHRQASLGLDLVAAGVFFWLKNGFSCPAWWVGLIPLFSATIYFEIPGALVSSVLLMLVYCIHSAFPSLVWQSMSLAGLMGLLTVILSLVLGFLSRKLQHNIPGDTQETPRIKLEKHLIEEKQLNENEKLRAVYDLTNTLMATLNYQRVCDTALDLSLSALSPEGDTTPDDSLVSAVLLFSKDSVLEVGSARRFTPADQRITLPGKQGAIARVIESGESILVQDVRQDEELNRIIALRVCNQVYCFPLQSGFNVYGIMIFGHPAKDYLTQDRVELLDILGRQVVIAIQNARLYQDLVDERDKMVEVQEEARKKLARDLHDGPTQSVAAMTMRINMARKLLEKDPQAASNELLKIEELAMLTSKEIRHMLFTLRPLVLESQGLIPALESMAEKMRDTYGQDVQIDINKDLLTQIELTKQGVIFYLVEESVTNARKHARAKNIRVSLQPVSSDLAFLEVRDNGIGFNVDEVNRSYDDRGSLGLINLQERAELINGMLQVQSEPGKGTSVQVAIPLTEDAVDRLHHAAGKR